MNVSVARRSEIPTWCGDSLVVKAAGTAAPSNLNIEAGSFPELTASITMR